MDNPDQDAEKGEFQVLWSCVAGEMRLDADDGTHSNSGWQYTLSVLDLLRLVRGPGPGTDEMSRREPGLGKLAVVILMVMLMIMMMLVTTRVAQMSLPYDMICMLVCVYERSLLLDVVGRVRRVVWRGS